MKVKFRTWFLSILIIGISVAFSASCKKAVDKLTTNCITSTACPGKTFKTCANAGGGGYYEYNGVKYSWNGSDPTTAANQLAAALNCK